jgi:tetratricopeptide (TPR) repeat protein
MDAVGTRRRPVREARRPDPAGARPRQPRQRAGTPGKPAESLHHAELALELFRAAGDPTGHAYALNVVGWGHAVLGDHRRAITYCQQALALQQRLGDRYHEAETLTRIGDTHHAGNEDAAAHEAWRLALTIIEELGHPDADLVRSKLRSARQPRFPVTKSG